MDEKKKILYRNIEALGDQYVEKILPRDGCDDMGYTREKLSKDWWLGLKFFLNHAFMQGGRGDKLSNDYFYFTMFVIHDWLDIDRVDRENSYKILRETELLGSAALRDYKPGRGNFLGREKDEDRTPTPKRKEFEKEIASKNPLINKLITRTEGVPVTWKKETTEKKLSLDKDGDLMMVLDTLRLVAGDGNHKNIYARYEAMLEGGEYKSAYDEIDTIWSIDVKVACFVIRDIALLNQYRFKLSEEENEEKGKKKRTGVQYAFPVDTWVRQVAHFFEIEVSGKPSDREIRDILLQKCDEAGVDKLKFAAGLWYAGFNSLDILLAVAGKTDIRKYLKESVAA